MSRFRFFHGSSTNHGGSGGGSKKVSPIDQKGEKCRERTPQEPTPEKRKTSSVQSSEGPLNEEDPRAQLQIQECSSDARFAENERLPRFPDQSVTTSDQLPLTIIEPTVDNNKSTVNSALSRSLKIGTDVDQTQRSFQIKAIFSSDKGKKVAHLTKEQRIKMLTGQLEQVNQENENLKNEVMLLTKEVERLNHEMREVRHNEFVKQKQRRLPGATVESKPGQLQIIDQNLVRHPKSQPEKEFLRGALGNNEFLRQLDKSQLKELVDCCQLYQVSKDDYLYKEGDPGHSLFIIEEGVFQVEKDQQPLGTLSVGCTTGESSVMYRCIRTSSCKAVSDSCKVWQLPRDSFQGVMLKSHFELRKEYTELLKNVPILSQLSENAILNVFNILQEVSFDKSAYIFRTGEIGKSFYIIKTGSVFIYKKKSKLSDTAVLVKQLGRGSCFGEKALLAEERRPFDAKAGNSGCVLLSIEADDFSMLINEEDEMAEVSDLPTSIVVTASTRHQRQASAGGYSNSSSATVGLVSNSATTPTSATTTTTSLFNKSGGGWSQRALNQPTSTATISSSHCHSLTVNENQLQRLGNTNAAKPNIIGPYGTNISKLRIDDLRVIMTRSNDRFSRLDLVSLKSNNKVMFMLKQIKKKPAHDANLHDKLLFEKKFLTQALSPFLITIHRTYKDRKYLYILYEPCLGGDMLSLLHAVGRLTDAAAKFYAACVVEAFAYLHKAGIIFRNFKTDNTYIDSNGYIKLIDLTFVKKLGHGSRAWSFIGEPEYIAPEIILNKGYDFAVDYWSLGIFIYEMLMGNTPFRGNDAMKIYNMALKGLEHVVFPHFITRNSAIIIKKLCKVNPHERLGSQKGGWNDVRKSKWFEHFEWAKLVKKELIAPHHPNILENLDNFDDAPYLKDNEIPPDDNTGWDHDF